MSSTAAGTGPNSQDNEDEWTDASDTSDYESDDEGKSSYKKGGYHPVLIGEKYNDRYIIEKKLGWGHFSTVWLASDCTLPEGAPYKLVALKIQKSASQYMDAALDEISLLELVCAKSEEHSEGKEYVVQLLDSFVISGPNGKHMCLVFEMMGRHILSLIKKFDHQGLSIPMVKVICKQILLGLSFLHTQCNIIHTDLKPENFLLAPTYQLDLKALEEERNRIREARRAPMKMKFAQFSMELSKKTGSAVNDAAEKIIGGQGTVVQKESVPQVCATNASTGNNKTRHRRPRKIKLRTKIADLGNACWTYKHFTDDVTTRQYRSPEVITGGPYGTPIDIWSVACMAFELLTGDYLFDPKEDLVHHRHSRNEDHLALMAELLGDIPQSLKTDGKYSKRLFNRHGELRNIRQLDLWGLDMVLVEKYKMSPTQAGEISSFLLPLLNMQQTERVTAEQALQHPWLKEVDVDQLFELNPPRSHRFRRYRKDTAPDGKKSVTEPGKPGTAPPSQPASSSTSTSTSTSLQPQPRSGRGGAAQSRSRGVTPHREEDEEDEEEAEDDPDMPSLDNMKIVDGQSMTEAEAKKRTSA